MDESFFMNMIDRQASLVKNFCYFSFWQFLFPCKVVKKVSFLDVFKQDKDHIPCLHEVYHPDDVRVVHFRVALNFLDNIFLIFSS